MAADAMSSPLGWPTRVMPRYFTLNTIPSSKVSLVSVQFSGSSGWTKTVDTGNNPNAVTWFNTARGHHYEQYMLKKIKV